MTPCEIINLNTIFGLSIEDLYYLIFPVGITIVFLYQMYIRNSKKRPLNKTERIIASLWILLVWAIGIVIILSR